MLKPISTWFPPPPSTFLLFFPHFQRLPVLTTRFHCLVITLNITTASHVNPPNQQSSFLFTGDPCNHNFCLNNGTCQRIEAWPYSQCICGSGYAGFNCGTPTGMKQHKTSIYNGGRNKMCPVSNTLTPSCYLLVAFLDWPEFCIMWTWNNTLSPLLRQEQRESANVLINQAYKVMERRKKKTFPERKLINS